MTYFSIGGTRYTGEDIATFSLVFLVILAVIAVVVWVVAASVKEKDNSKPLQMGKVKILEKPIQQGNIEWYVVEFENGERKRLRSFNGTRILITVGDEGLIGYRGETIESFQPEQR